MARTVQDLLLLGSREFLNFLQFAIVSGQPEPVFIHCVREYRFRPTTVAALGIFDHFCETNALWRLRETQFLPPLELTLANQIRMLREAFIASQQPLPSASLEEDEPSPVLPAANPMPPGNLFRTIETGLLSNSDGFLARLAATYDPALGPFENLPGGKMTSAQRLFVDQYWIRRIRPALVSAGFWRLASLGQP
jgi:hypothetical protein